MIFQIIVLDVTGYETYGQENSVGFFSTLEKAMSNLPKEEDMTHDYGHLGVLRMPFFDGVLCILERGIDENQYVKLIWSEKPEEVKGFFENN